MNIPENILSSLTDEQKKKVEAAQTPEELRPCKGIRIRIDPGAAGSRCRGRLRKI